MAEVYHTRRQVDEANSSLSPAGLCFIFDLKEWAIPTVALIIQLL